MYLHTWNFGKISYDCIIYESGIGNRLDGLFTMLNMEEHIHMWNHAIELYNTRSHLVADADVLHNRWWQSYRSHLCTICDPIRCTVFLAQWYGHIALVDHQIFSLSQTKTSYQQVTEETITSLYGVVTVNQ